MKTTDNFEWNEVSPGYWKDETTGLVWGPKLKGEFNFEDAQKEAAKLNDLGLKWSVPTKKEWLMAEIHDAREVFPDIKGCFWSSSPYPDFADLAFYFFGDYGSMYDDTRDYSLSVRCCAR